VEITVIVPTRDRPDKLGSLIGCLARASSPVSFEIVVVDDGSDPPVRIASEDLRCRIVRLEGVERSVARNTGAHAAQGRLLLFLDDDLSFGPDLLEQHWGAFREWPGALLVGAVRLPEEAKRTPFGRFRARLERQNVPIHRGPVESRAFCTAANLAVPRETFRELGGFDPSMTSAEDQDLAMRHTARDGRVVFVPEALVVHHDDALDASSYGARVEWGAAQLGPFLRRYPDWPDNVERERVNGPIRICRERPSMTLKKILKATLATDVGTRALLAAIVRFESVASQSPVVQRLYEIVVGVHLLRGHRRRRALKPLEHGKDDPSLLRAS
jgi:glycosyltransferase involved in cell wall biosynthesis